MPILVKAGESIPLPSSPFKIKIENSSGDTGLIPITDNGNSLFTLMSLEQNTTDYIPVDFRYPTLLRNTSDTDINVQISHQFTHNHGNVLTRAGMDFNAWKYYERESLDSSKLHKEYDTSYIYRAVDTPLGNSKSVILRNMPDAISRVNPSKAVHQVLYEAGGTAIYIRAGKLGDTPAYTEWQMVSPPIGQKHALEHLTVSKADYDAKVQELEGRITDLESRLDVLTT